MGDPELLASIIRKEIVDTTGCTASAGIAENMLMARLATTSAKPDGQCYIPRGKVQISYFFNNVLGFFSRFTNLCCLFLKNIHSQGVIVSK